MKLLKYIISIVIVLLMGSCNEDWLELTNPNQQTSGTFWKSEHDILKGVNATYQSLNYDGTWLRFAPIALDLRGDDMLSPSPWHVLQNTGTFKLFNNTIMQEWLWVAFYGGVYRANQVITHIEEVEFTDQGMYNRLKGEALFLRGFYYFYLVNFFNHIPLITKPFESSEEYYSAQNTPEEVWAQIIADFSEAAALLPTSYSGVDIGRANKGAALGFLGKSYLFTKDFQKASDAFKQVMNLGVYGLMENYGDNFTEAFENNKESVFEIQFSREVGGTDLGWVWVNANKSQTTAKAITYAPTPFGWGDAAPTRWIFNKFLEEKTIDGNDDPRLRATIQYNYEGCVLYGRSFQEVYANNLNKLGVKKYCNDQSGRPDEKDWRSGINERVMRYADILMMYAECQNELGNQAECAKYIQIVRDRANLPDREAEFAAYSQSQMRERISDERALEFALEGHRFDDLLRWGWMKDAAKLQILREHDSEFNSYVAGREFFSIPQHEIETNPKLVQNPGY